MENIKIKSYRLLRLMEKYTHTDMVYLASGGFWVVTAQIVAAASSFLLSLAFANLISKDTYGTYKFVLSVYNIITVSTLAGMATAVTRAVAQGKEGSFIAAVKTKMKWGILGAAGSIVIGAYYFLNGNNILALAFFIVAFFLPMLDPFNLYDSFLLGKKAFKASGLLDSADQIFATLALIATMLLTKNILIIVLVYFAAWTIGNFIVLNIVLKKFRPNKEVGPDTLSYGKHLSVMQIINSIAAYFDILLVYHYLGATQLAIYSFAIAPPEQIKGFAKTLESLVLPKFSQRESHEIKSTLTGKMLRLGIVLIIITAIYILLAPIAYHLLFPKYTESVFYSQIFSLSLATMVGVFPLAALESQAAKKQLYIYNTVNPLIQILILFFMIYNFGLMGAILARVITRFINLTIIIMLAKRT